MIINILKDSTGSLDTELVFVCPICHRTFKHNDFQFPARWEDAIRKHLLKAHNGKRLGWDIVEIPDDEDLSHTFFPEGGNLRPPSQSGRGSVGAEARGTSVSGATAAKAEVVAKRSNDPVGSNPTAPTHDELKEVME